MEMQVDLCSSRIVSSFREESGDEGLSVLPRHTKVIVTGNNRTKSVLVGLQGVVKKAVGLGGWHWLVLKNGVEVKLQRNALSVLEHPTGNEEDEEEEFDNSSDSSEISVTHNDHLCRRFEFRRVSKPRVRYTRPWSPSLSPKSTRHCGFKEVQSIVQTSKLRVSFAKLGTSSLGKYCRNFKLGCGNPNLTREQVINVVQQHFVSQKVDEVQVIAEFIRAAKRLKSADRYRCA